MTDGTRNLIRGVSGFVIVMTLPFYLCGIVLLATLPANDGSGTSSDPFPTFTPFDPGSLGNTDTEATITPLFTPINPNDFGTGNDNNSGGFDPPIAATNTRQVDIPFDQVIPPTVLPPTVTPTPTATSTPPPTDTLAPTLTSLPAATETQPIILPASDTPQP